MPMSHSKAFRRLQEMLAEQRDEAAIIDLRNIHDQFCESIETIPMEEDPFPAESLVQQLIVGLRSQDVKLMKSTWSDIASFHVEQCKERSYDKLSEVGMKARIGLEALFLHSKISANELYERITGLPSIGMLPAQTAKRNDYMEERFLAVLTHLKKPISITLQEETELAVKLKKWLLSDAATKVITTVINGCIDPIDMFRVDQVQIRSTLTTMKIYVCEGLGYLKGCVLRDGILISQKYLVDSSRNPTTVSYWADIYCLVLHEASHFCVRKNFDDYGYSSPTSYVRTGNGQFRRDPDLMINNKKLELGRAAEMYVFGGHPDGIQIDWERSDVKSASEFVKHVENGDVLPWFKNKQDCLEKGMKERKNISLSFGGEMVHRGYRDEL